MYCLARNKIEQTAEWLREQGFDALPYHAGLPAEVRAQHQRRFIAEDGVIVVATIAFGMGIDKPDVRFVAHLDLPKSIESYYQETGRAGRDGEPADAWMIYGLQDVVQLRALVDASEADEQHKRRERHKLDALLGWCELTECRRRPLLAYFGEQPRQRRRAATATTASRRPRPGTGPRPRASCCPRSIAPGSRSGPRTSSTCSLGNATEKVERHGHDGLSVFGIGADLEPSCWRSLLRQLVVRGRLRVDHERFGALALTDASRGLLRGEEALRVREDAKDAVPRRKSRATPCRTKRPRRIASSWRRCASAGAGSRASRTCLRM